MTKLKTINDFETYFDGKIEFDKIGKEDDPYDFWINRGELKAEAVKWCKYYEDMGENIAVLMAFHNITEEDLK